MTIIIAVLGLHLISITDDEAVFIFRNRLQTEGEGFVRLSLNIPVINKDKLPEILLYTIQHRAGEESFISNVMFGLVQIVIMLERNLFILLFFCSSSYGHDLFFFSR